MVFQAYVMTGIATMKLSDGEKLILFMLSELYEKLGIEGEMDPKFIKSAICSGNTWGLKWQYTGIFDSGETKPELVTEVANILDMWSCNIAKVTLCL